MADDPESAAEIKDSDIVFDCPHCGKSLAIDYRGAGLNIECTDCGNSVIVPIPDRMELTDIDSTPEEQEIRILNLRKSLSAAQERIEELDGRIGELTERRRALEQDDLERKRDLATVLERVNAIHRSLAEIYRALDGISEAAGGSS